MKIEVRKKQVTPLVEDYPLSKLPSHTYGVVTHVPQGWSLKEEELVYRGKTEVSFPQTGTWTSDPYKKDLRFRPLREDEEVVISQGEPMKIELREKKVEKKVVDYPMSEMKTNSFGILTQVHPTFIPVVGDVVYRAGGGEYNYIRTDTRELSPYNTIRFRPLYDNEEIVVSE